MISRGPPAVPAQATLQEFLPLLKQLENDHQVTLGPITKMG